MKKRYIGLFSLAAGAILLGAAAASAEILAAKSPEQKHRADVGKQVSKLVLCIVKQSEKCEKKGTSAAQECDLSDPPSSTIADGKAKTKFIDGIAKCESKLNLTKKGPASNYSVFGCPGDSVPGGTDDPYADMAAFGTGISPTARTQLDLLGVILNGLCTGDPLGQPDAASCVLFQIKNGAKYSKGVYNCMGKCENDYQDKKGNGGTFDDPAQCYPGNASADDNFESCVNDTLAKAEKKGQLHDGLIAAINGALGDANNDLYNENDCP